jgi:rubrerythrin
MNEGKITKFKVEKKSRMAPERYENARTLEQAAQDEKAHARQLEKLLQEARNNQVNEVTYVDVKNDD